MFVSREKEKSMIGSLLHRYPGLALMYAPFSIAAQPVIIVDHTPAGFNAEER